MEAETQLPEVEEPRPIFFTLANPVNLLNALKTVGGVKDDEVPVIITGNEIKVKTLDHAEVSMIEVVFQPATLRTQNNLPIGFNIRLKDFIQMFPKLKPKAFNSLYRDS